MHSLSYVPGDEEYLILGCDGLWDTIEPPIVIEMVQKHLGNGGARSEVAKLLVDQAIAHGSTDNVTVIVVFLDNHTPVCEKSPEIVKEVAEEKNGDENACETIEI